MFMMLHLCNGSSAQTSIQNYVNEEHGSKTVTKLILVLKRPPWDKDLSNSSTVEYKCKPEML